MPGYSYINIAVLILAFMIGLLVFTRNARSGLNRIFFIMTTLISSWALVYVLLDVPDSPDFSSLLNRFSHLISVVAMVAVVGFSLKLNESKIGKLESGIISLSLLVMLVLSPTSLISGNVYDSAGLRVYDYGSLYSIYVSFLIVSTAYVFLVLGRGIRRQASTAAQHQNRLVLFGLMMSMICVTLTGAVLPYLGLFASLSELAPSSVIFLISLTGYAIVKHKLFDIRLVVARSLAYILLLSTIVGFFGFFVFYLARTVLPVENQFLSQQLIPLFTSIVLAALFQPMKRFFDKLTNSLFFRDAYDAQEFLDELNKNIVNNIDIDQLLPLANQIIVRNIKSDYSAFMIRSTEHTKERVIGNMRKTLSEADMKQLQKSLHRMRAKVVMTDDLAGSDTDRELRSVLIDHDIGIVARLATKLDSEESGVGYLFLGNKKSGNPFGKQDARVLEIVANELVIAVQNALRFEEIEKFNITLQNKVEDATHKLRLSNQKLKTLDQTKDEFISMASHQLRTPLTSVKGYLSMVLEGDAGDISPMQRKLLDQAFISSQRMVYLIADLLNVSRLKTGKFIIEAMPTNLADVVEGEVGQLVETALGRNLELTYKKPENFPVLSLDETKIRQVIMNFIDNAIYYTPAGGHISVNLVDKGSSVEFTVVDDGLGVPKADQPHLFGKFFRAPNAKSARPDGTGLGLFMAKKVIVAQNGAILFHSEEGKGSTFGFSFAKDKLQPKSPTPAA